MSSKAQLEELVRVKGDLSSVDRWIVEYLAARPIASWCPLCHTMLEGIHKRVKEARERP